MKNLAIIPGKLYSERCPNKNTKYFCGKPIVEWTLDAALDSELFDKIILFSDIPDWQLYSRKTKKIEVMSIHNPITSDDTSFFDIIEYVFLSLKRAYYTNFCCLFVTAPLRYDRDIVAAYYKMIYNNLDVVMGVTKFTQPWWQRLIPLPVTNRFYYLAEGNSLGHKRENELRGPDRKSIVDNGSMYWANVDAFFEHKTFYLPSLGVYEMPYERSIDINTETDWMIAEMLGKKYLKI